MAEPTPPDNQTSRSESSRSGGVVQDAPSSGTSDKQGPLVFRLVPPLPATNLQRRAADAMRRRLRWSEGSPPGVYWNGDVDPYHRFLVKGIGRDGGAQVDLLNPLGHQGISTNTAADDPDSDAEDLSGSEGSGSDFSAPPVTPPPQSPHESKTMKSRATLSSGSHGIPCGRLLEVALDDAENKLELDRQGYMLEIIISRSPGQFVDDGRNPLFKMHVDTASDLTWVLGENHRHLEAKFSPDGDVLQMVIDKWHTSHQSHDVLSPNLVPWDENNAREILKPPFDRAYVSYNDEGIALVEELTEPEARQFVVANMLSWNDHKWNERIVFPAYRWSVANAVDEQTANDPTNGSLALGLRRSQAINSRRTTGPSERDILSVLASRAIPLSAFGPDGAGHTLFYVLNPTYADHDADPSCIAINQWPFDPVEFSEKIPVRPDADGTYDFWTVEMVQMDFFEVRLASDTKEYTRELLCSIDLTENGSGELFSLDTGSSTSDFPPVAVYAIMDMIQTIVAGVGPDATTNSQDTTTDSQDATTDSQDATTDSVDAIQDSNANPESNADSESDSATDIYIELPEAFRAMDVEIDFTFRGEGDTTVTVTGPDLPFLFQDGQGGSLLFATASGKQNILGLNFFQTMFVAMHRPDSRRQVPWVRLAPQPNFGVSPSSLSTH